MPGIRKEDWDELTTMLGGGGLDGGAPAPRVEEPDFTDPQLELPHSDGMFDEMHPPPFKGDDRAAGTETLERLRNNPDVTGEARAVIERAMRVRRRRVPIVVDGDALNAAIGREYNRLTDAGKTVAVFDVQLALTEAVERTLTTHPDLAYAEALVLVMKQRSAES